MKRLFPGCLIIIAVSFLLGCGLNTVVFYVIPTLNQNKWNELKPERYSLTVYNGSVVGSFRTYEESVADGVAERTYSDFFRVSEPTIDELFNEIKANTLNPFGFLLIISTEYDPVYGYPIRIERNDFDLGQVTEIKDFTPEN